MGGGLGMESMEESIRILLSEELDIEITVVTGSNEDLKKELEEEYKNKISEGSLKVYGYTTEISNIMDNSDLIVTKPGGLTITECIAKKLPMIIPFYILGQEEENIEFLKRENIANILEDVTQLPDAIKELIENKEIYNRYIDNMSNLSNKYSIENIKKLVNKIVLEKKK